MHKNDKLAKEFKEKVLNENIKYAVKKEVKAMNEIEWEDGKVCYAYGEQYADPIISSVLGAKDFQLNEIRQGDYISASELDTEQKYNDAVEVFELFKYLKSSTLSYDDVINLGGMMIDDQTTIHAETPTYPAIERKITYSQLMAIGKLKRAMIEKSAPKIAPDLTPDVEFKDGNKYHRTIYGLCGTPVKVDVYRVSDAFPTGSAPIDHAVKKMLCAGLRGHKDKLTDIDNAIESLQAARLLLIQKGEL